MAKDYDAINLGQGFPDFDADQRLLDLVTRAMYDGHNQYPFMTGVDTLRQVISEKISSLYRKTYDPDKEITVTSGATEAIMSCVLATIHAGDEVVVLEPSYDCYVPAIKLAGGIPIKVPMNAPTALENSYTVDWDRVLNAINTRTRMMIVNSPHNPTGFTFTRNDLDQLEKIVSKWNIILLSDEVYEHIVFDQNKHQSLSSRPALAERSFVISSFGKTTHTTGWKIGYCCAPEAMSIELRKVHQFNVFTVPSPFQHALASYTKDAETYLNLSNFYQAKRDRLAEGLEKTRFQTLQSTGTFFLLANYSDISKAPEAEFSVWLAKTHGVVVIPVSAFYGNPSTENSNHHLVRFCFAKKDTTLDEAINRLMRI